jgi:predicted TIM-barrel fold metal-dependent hydrolase
MNKIIDIHAHLGDILYGEDIIFQNGKKVPPSKDEDFYYDGLKLALSRFINTNGKLFEYFLTEKSSQKAVKAHIPRNNACTLENMGQVMDDNQISGMVALPVHPYVSFEDVLEASKVDRRVIPFTSIDYSLGRDAGKKLLEDVKNGAQGLKIHPIIQRKSLLDEDTIEALTHWEQTGKPVQPHLGVYYYYPIEERHLQSPENGKYDDFKKIFSMFPNIRFIAAHSAGFEWKRLIEDGKDLDNLYLDLSFVSRVQMKAYLKKWPIERLLYGSDWPWGNPEITLKVIDLSVKDPEATEMILYKNAKRLLGI